MTTLAAAIEQAWRGLGAGAASSCPNGCGQPYDRHHGHLTAGLSTTEAEVACLRHVRRARRGRG